MHRQTNRLIFQILLAFLVLNLLLPGESHALSLVLSQVVIYGLAAIYLLFLRPRREMTRTRPLLLLLAAALIVGQIVAIHQFGSLQAAVQLVSIALMAWLIADINPGEGEVNLGFSVLFAAAVLLSVFGLLQIFTYFAQAPDAELIRRVLPVSERYIDQVYAQKRIFATFALPTTFSSFLAMTIPLGAALAWINRRRLMLCIPISVGILLALAAMIQSKSHGGPAALLAAVAVTVLLFLRKRRRALLWAMAATILAAAAAVIAIGLLRGYFLWDLAAPENPVGLRWNLWAAGLEMLSRNWLVGVGLGNFHIGFLPFLGPGVRPTKFLHNTYMQIPVELGVLGLVLVVVVGLILRKVWRETSQGDGAPQTAMRAGIVAAAMAFLFANGVEIILYFHSVGLLGAFLVGLLMRRQPHEASAAHKESAAQTLPGMHFYPLRIGLALLFIAAMFLLGRWFVADYFYLKGVEKVTLASLQPEVADPAGIGTGEHKEGGDRETALRRWRSVVDLAHVACAVEDGNHEYHYLLGRGYERLADLGAEDGMRELARKHYERAVALCPELPYLRYSLGLALLREGRLLAATEQVERAADLHPTSDDYRKALDVLLRRIELTTSAARAMREGGGQ